jgi:hypothetical protein
MIPENNNKTNYVEIVINRVLEKLEKNDYVSLNRTDCYNTGIAEDVARMFAKKKYHVKITYFLNGQVQFLIVSRNPLRETTGRMVYSVDF